MKSISVLTVIGLLAALPVGATPLSYSTGLASPLVTIDFSGAPIGTMLDSVYQSQGITLSGLYGSNAIGTFGTSVPPEAANFNGETTKRTFTIGFDAPTTDAAFFLYTDGYGSTITSSLGGIMVETVAADTYHTDNADYFGFTGSSFDMITVTIAGDNKAVIDNLQIGSAPAAVPEPGSSAILAVGLAGLMLVGARRRV